MAQGVTIKGAGGNENIEAAVDPTRQGVRVSLQPLEWNLPNTQAGGHYRVAQISGAVAGAVSASAELWNFRWTDSNRVAVVKHVAVYAIYTAVSTPVYVDFDLIKATGWTTSGSGGSSTNVTNPTKMWTRMGASSFAATGDLRVAGTAAITAGTKTFDAAAIGYVPGQLNEAATPVANNTAYGGDLYKHDKMAGHPIVLNANEGLTIRTPKGWGASNTLQITAICEWAELPLY